MFSLQGCRPIINVGAVCRDAGRPPWPVHPRLGPRASDGWLARVPCREMLADGFTFRWAGWAVAMPRILGPDAREPVRQSRSQVYVRERRLYELFLQPYTRRKLLLQYYYTTHYVHYTLITYIIQYNIYIYMQGILGLFD